MISRRGKLVRIFDRLDRRLSGMEDNVEKCLDRIEQNDKMLTEIKRLIIELSTLVSDNHAASIDAVDRIGTQLNTTTKRVQQLDAQISKHLREANNGAS